MSQQNLFLDISVSAGKWFFFFFSVGSKSKSLRLRVWYMIECNIRDLAMILVTIVLLT